MASSTAQTLCTHFLSGQCKFGDRCIKQHGKNDSRTVCIECLDVRSPPGCERCSHCHKWFEENCTSPAHQMCHHFNVGTCQFGDKCIKQHGDLDERMVCVDCDEVRAPPGCERCGRCYKVHREQEVIVEESATPGETRCKMFDADKCKYGDKCIKQHDEDDIRLICMDCESVRCPTDCERCSRCYQEYRKNKPERSEKIHVEHNMLSCKRCNKDRVPIASTGELYCKKCDELKNCTTKGCKNKCIREECGPCYDVHSKMTVRKCQMCNATIYPGSDGCETCAFF